MALFNKISRTFNTNTFLLLLLVYCASASAKENNASASNLLNTENFSPYFTSSPFEPVVGTNHNSVNLLNVLPSESTGYNKNVLPSNIGKPTIVYFHVTILNINNINEVSMTYEAEILVSQHWRDDRLNASESDQGVVDSQLINDIWRPEYFFKNAKSVKFHENPVPNQYLWLYPNKTLLYMSRFSLLLSCPMDFRTFPHDRHFCYFDMESFSHTTTELVFEWDHANPLYIYSHNIELPQFEVEKTEALDCTLEYSTGNVTCLSGALELRRRQGYYLFHTYIPSALLVALSWISFWMRPQAKSARFTFCIIILLLTLVVQNGQTFANLSKVSHVMAIDIWMSGCTLFVLMSLLEYFLVNHFLDGGNSGNTKCKDFYELESIADSESAQHHLQATPNSWDNSKISTKLDRVSRILFPTLFIVFIILYCLTYLI